MFSRLVFTGWQSNNSLLFIWNKKSFKQLKKRPKMTAVKKQLWAHTFWDKIWVIMQNVIGHNEHTSWGNMYNSVLDSLSVRFAFDL